MSESLRDQLLKSGLARKFKAEPQKPAKPPHKPAPPKRERSEMDLAKAYALRDNSERAERERAQREAEERAREKRERRQKLANALSRRPERQRSVFMLSHYEWCTSREVSALTGLNESTVRVHLFRAIRRLRTLLTDDGQSALRESGQPTEITGGKRRVHP